MNYALCNELCEGWPLDDVCTLAKRLGYAGIEFAPFTLASSITDVSSAQRQTIADTCADQGLDVVGLHWLLAKTDGFHINHPDDDVRKRTMAYYRELIQCCADIGGDVMIHGSPQQRNVIDGDDPRKARERTVAFFKEAATAAQDAGVTLCLEPLGPQETNILSTTADAAAMVHEIDHPNVGLILDCKAMSAEGGDIPALIREHADILRHFHANDANRSYPGSGDVDFVPILSALRDAAYDGYVSIEVFTFDEGAEVIATKGIEYLKACNQ